MLKLNSQHNILYTNFSCKHRSIKLKNFKLPSKNNKDKAGIGYKIAWYASEFFGNVVSKPVIPSPDDTGDIATSYFSREEVLESIKSDYKNDYFVNGSGQMQGYEDNCLFLDEFTSFRGVKRFKNNVTNFGQLTEDVKCEIVKWSEFEDKLIVQWRFSSILKLPWRPKLAAGGTTTYIFNNISNKVIEHREEWKTEPKKVFEQLLKPSSKIPKNRWEDFFFSLNKKDVLGMWLAINQPILFTSAIFCTIISVNDLLREERFQGFYISNLEKLTFLVFLISLVTEVYHLFLYKNFKNFDE